MFTLTVMNGQWLQLIRRIHLYLSVFFTPLLLLFIITGWAQTVGFQTSIMKKFSEVHTGQYFPTTSASTITINGEKVELSGQRGDAAEVDPRRPDGDGDEEF